jgi:pimeloyl-ACP methyl ester carboxylesterase
MLFVHGACVRDGAWWWHRTAELLQAEGMPSATAVLPSCGEAEDPAGASGPGLPEDVAAVRRLLIEDDAPTIVIAHSYGGILTAEAAAGVESVRHLLLIASYVPEVGESLSSFADGSPAPFLDADDGTFGVRPDLLVDTFLQDCDS